MSVSGFTQGSPSTPSAATSSSHQPSTKQLKVAEAASSEASSVKVLNESDDELEVNLAVPNVPEECSDARGDDDFHDADSFVPNADRQLTAQLNAEEVVAPGRRPTPMHAVSPRRSMSAQRRRTKTCLRTTT